MKKVFLTFVLIVSINAVYSVSKYRTIKVTTIKTNISTLKQVKSDSVFITERMLGDSIAVEYTKLFNGYRKYYKDGVEYTEYSHARLN